MSRPEQFTGRQRRRVTKWTVALSDRLARVIIAVGGIGTIVAVSLVCVFLAWVVVPLFLPATVEPAKTLKNPKRDNDILALGIDDYRTVGWGISKGGAVSVFRLDTGEVVEHIAAEKSPVAGAASAAVDIDGHAAAFGMDDGKVRLAQIEFDDQIIPADQAPPVGTRINDRQNGDHRRRRGHHSDRAGRIAAAKIHAHRAAADRHWCHVADCAPRLRDPARRHAVLHAIGRWNAESEFAQRPSQRFDRGRRNAVDRRRTAVAEIDGRDRPIIC